MSAFLGEKGRVLVCTKEKTKMLFVFRENYIKLDVFYKELSYELVKQQVAFEFLSLVSEIGGFMGLLLGASVLTVCELVDYLSLVLMRKCSATSNVTKRAARKGN